MLVMTTVMETVQASSTNQAVHFVLVGEAVVGSHSPMMPAQASAVGVW